MLHVQLGGSCPPPLQLVRKEWVWRKWYGRGTVESITFLLDQSKKLPVLKDARDGPSSERIKKIERIKKKRILPLEVKLGFSILYPVADFLKLSGILWLAAKKDRKDFTRPYIWIFPTNGPGAYTSNGCIMEVTD
ncbi:hypothetical protein NPIL_591951 [Nephila pilipes]|uniref:Uncharacterized protein n=1 Tax=Nephila pilipes TaxID=299642 RepID=A0A8X6TZS8_NEPPI|nr:hypothetical protein NPIL_591951 [Nephila pilipes]